MPEAVRAKFGPIRARSRSESKRRAPRAAVDPAHNIRAAIFATMELLESRQYLSAAPVISGLATGTAGTPYTLDLSSTSGTPNYWTINWADGANGGADDQIVTGSTSSITHTFNYNSQPYDISAVASYSGGPITATCDVLNSSGGIVAQTGSQLQVAVGLAPADVMISGSSAAAQNSVYSLDLSAISPTYNQGNGAITSWTVNWGDGLTQTFAQSSTFNPAWATVTHVYSAGSGIFDILASASNGSTSYAATPLAVTINAGAQTTLTASAGEAFDAGNLDGTGSVSVGAGVSISASRVRENSLSVSGTLTIDAGAEADDIPNVSVVDSLSLGTNIGGSFLGTLNLQNNTLIIQCTSAANEQSVYNMVYSALASGYNNGLWNGTGIDSSAAASDPTHSTALGVIVNNGYYASYRGQTVNPYAVIVAYTKNGDTNLDGMVNTVDFSTVASNFSHTATWATGDFNYGGVDNGQDFVEMANNFGAIMPFGNDPDNSLPAQYLYSFLGNSSTPASDFTANITWGDGTSGAGAIVADGNGQFHVVGSHVYQSAGVYSITVSVTAQYSDATWVSTSTATVGAATSGAGTSVLTPYLPNLPYITPSSDPQLPSTMNQFAPPVTNVAVASGAPILAAADSMGGPNDTITITGSNLTAPGDADPYNDTLFFVYGQTTGSDGTLSQAQIQDLTPNGATVTISSSEPSDSMYFIWAVNNAGPGGQETASAPIAINQTQATWVGAPGETLAQTLTGQTVNGYLGQTLSVYGTNLSNGASNQQSWVYLQPTSGGAGTWATVSDANSYKVDFVVPGTLSVGTTYQIWINNGLGGDYSWSEAPTTLTVTSTSAPSWAGSTIVNVQSFGAVGDGVTNDLTAIRNAINSLQDGDTLYFPAGTYVVDYGPSDTSLLFPASVSGIRVMGASTSTSTILFEGDVPAGNNSFEIGELQPAQNNGPNIGMGGIEFDQLTMEYNGLDFNSVSAPDSFISLTDRTNYVFNNVSVISGPLETINLQGSSQVTIENSTLIGQAVSLLSASNVIVNNDQFFSAYQDNAINAQQSYDVSVTNCTVQNYDDSVDNPSGWGGGRLFYMTPPSYNEYLADNTTINFGAQGNLFASGVAGSGEEVLSEGGSDAYNGFITAASANSVTFTTTAAPSHFYAGLSVIVTAGTGLGQMETVQTASDTYNSGTYTYTLTLGGNWNDVPTIAGQANASTIEIVPDVYNSVFYNNTLQDQTGANGASTLADSAGFEFFDGAYNIVLDDNTTENLDTGAYLSSNDNNNPNDFIQIVNNQFQNSAIQGVYVASYYVNSSDASPNDVGVVVRKSQISGSPIGINLLKTGAAAQPSLTVLEQNTIEVASTSAGSNAAGILAYNDPNVLAYQNTFVAPTGVSPAPAILYTDGSASGLLLRDNTYLNYGSNAIYSTTSGGSALPASTLATPYNMLGASVTPGNSVTLVIPLLDDGPQSITWMAASNESWASLQSTSGSISSEDSTGAVDITLNSSGLSAGLYLANIAVSANGITKDIGIWFFIA